MGQNQSKTKSFECCVGETIRLESTNLQNRSKDCIWVFNGKKIKTKSCSSEYVIDEAACADSGTYKCKIDGKVDCKFRVNVYNYLFDNNFLGIRMKVTGSDSLAGDVIQKHVQPIPGQKSGKVEPSNDNEDCKLTVLRMDRNPRGIAVIIGIENFDNLAKLEGIKKDIENCKATFGQLHFDVRVCDSTKSDKIITYLKKIANMNHTKYDCFILYISSHGGQGYMCCSDYCSSNTNEYGREDKQASGYIYIDTLVETFMSKKCKTLKDKPKLFYFDCCRNHGSKMSEITNGSPIRAYKNIKELAKHYSNILIGYATISGTSTGIDSNGSHYTNVLTNCMKSLAPEHSLADVMTQVVGTMMKNHSQVALYESTIGGQIKMKKLDSDTK